MNPLKFKFAKRSEIYLVIHFNFFGLIELLLM